MVRYFMKSNLYKLTVFKILISTLSNYFMQDTLKNSTSKSDMLTSHQLSDDDEDDTESIDMNTSVNPMLNTENTLDEEQETSSIQVTDVTVESTAEPKDRAERNSEEVGDAIMSSNVRTSSRNTSTGNNGSNIYRTSVKSRRSNAKAIADEQRVMGKIEKVMESKLNQCKTKKNPVVEDAFKA